MCLPKAAVIDRDCLIASGVPDLPQRAQAISSQQQLQIQQQLMQQQLQQQHLQQQQLMQQQMLQQMPQTQQSLQQLPATQRTILPQQTSQGRLGEMCVGGG